MAENRITKKWLKNHWTYSWWKYLLLVCVCGMGVNVLFTMTAYRAPEHKKIELYVCNGYVDQQVMDEQVSREFFARFPEQEEMAVMNINLAAEDMYVQMQFTTYLAAQQGDILMLPRSEVYKLSESGADNAFMELTLQSPSHVFRVSREDGEQRLVHENAKKMVVFLAPGDLALYRLQPGDEEPCTIEYYLEKAAQ